MTELPSLLLVLGSIAPCAVAIKLSFTYIAILPAILIFLYTTRHSFIATIQNQKHLYVPMGAFFFIAFYSSFFGLSVLHSLEHAGKLAFMCTLIPLYATFHQQGHRKTVLFSLAIGLGIESAHTIFAGAYPHIIREYAHGPVSEAGQLGIGIFAVLALLFLLKEEYQEEVPIDIAHYSMVPFLGFVLLGFSIALHLSTITTLSLALIGIAWILFQSGRVISSQSQERPYHFVLSALLPLIAAALLVNLKRGPWIGVSCGLGVLLLMTRPKLLFLIIPLGLALVFGFDPIRTRMFSALHQFHMVGNRGEIWNLALELLIRYPLGIGLNNADIIRDFSYDIPTNLRHFHSNILNITVELGWLGALAFIWWMVALLKYGLTARQYSSQDPSQKKDLITIALTCGILSWQIAGLVEYNVGDSEVFILAAIVMGLIVGTKNNLKLTQVQ